MAQLPNKVFVGSLPSNTKPEALRHLFEKHGEVVQCDVVNRCGFVYMQTAEMVEKCVASLNGTDFKGNKIVVEVGRPEKKAPEAAGAAAAAAAGVAAKPPKRVRQQQQRVAAKAPIRAVANNTIGGKKQRGRGGLIGGPMNPGGFPAGISPDVKEAVTMRLAGAIMELFKENPNALFDSSNNGGGNMPMNMPPHPHPKGGHYMGGGNGPVGPRGHPHAQRQVGGPPPGKRPDKVPRNNAQQQQQGPQLFTRRPMPNVEKPKPSPQGPIKGKITPAPPAPQGPIKGKVTAGPPAQDLKKRPRRPAEWKPKRPDGGPVAGPGPRPNGVARRNEGFNNSPNMNYNNGPMGGGGPGRGMGGGNAGPHNNNTNTYVWRNENLNSNRGGNQGGGMMPNGGGPVAGGGGMGGGGGGGGGGNMGRGGFNDNFANNSNNSNSMYNQGGGGNQAMGQDRRGFALPNYQQQQQHQQSAFLQSNFDGVMNPGGFTTGVSNVVNNGGRRAGPAGGNGSSFSSGYGNGQNMNYENRGGGSGFRSGGFSRGMDNMDNGGGGGGMNSGGFGGGFDGGSMPRGNFNFSNNSKMFDDDLSLGSNRNNIGGGNMYSSGGGGGGGFNRNNDMDMNHMNRNTDQWSMMNNRRFNN